MRKNLLLRDCATLSFYSDAEHVVGYRPIYRCSIAKYAPMCALIAKKDYVARYYNHGKEPFMFVSGHDSRESDRYFHRANCTYEDCWY